MATTFHFQFTDILLRVTMMLVADCHLVGESARWSSVTPSRTLPRLSAVVCGVLSAVRFYYLRLSDIYLCRRFHKAASPQNMATFGLVSK